MTLSNLLLTMRHIHNLYKTLQPPVPSSRNPYLLHQHTSTTRLKPNLFFPESETVSDFNIANDLSTTPTQPPKHPAPSPPKMPWDCCICDKWNYTRITQCPNCGHQKCKLCSKGWRPASHGQPYRGGRRRDPSGNSEEHGSVAGAGGLCVGLVDGAGTGYTDTIFGDQS